MGSAKNRASQPRTAISIARNRYSRPRCNPGTAFRRMPVAPTRNAERAALSGWNLIAQVLPSSRSLCTVGIKNCSTKRVSLNPDPLFILYGGRPGAGLHPAFPSPCGQQGFGVSHYLGLTTSRTDLELPPPRAVIVTLVSLVTDNVLQV